MLLKAKGVGHLRTWCNKDSSKVHITLSRSPSSALLPFVGEGSPTKIDVLKKTWYPYANLSTGGPSC